MIEPAKIFIGVASRNLGFWSTFTSIMSNMHTLGPAGHRTEIMPLVGDSLISRARNEMQARFLETDCTHFIQVDDDIQLPPDGILKLVEADKDIVGGAYLLKDGLETCALRALNKFDIADFPNQLVKIHYLSTGCFMQKRHVCEKMIEEYPDLHYISHRCLMSGDPPDRYNLYNPMIYENELLSEDWAYCQRAIDAGFDVWLHTGVLCGHWGLHHYTFKEQQQSVPKRG